VKLLRKASYTMQALLSLFGSFSHGDEKIVPRAG